MKRIDLLGKKFGRLTVVSFDKTLKKAAFWNCQCACGNMTSITSASLRYGFTKSCGCLSTEMARARSTKHGESKSTKEYRAWSGLKSRCYIPSDKRFKQYSERGITVCDRWINSFENFLTDMGRAPSKKHSIDRIDNNGNYEPMNCRWATDGEQANNRTKTKLIEYDGEIKSMANWARCMGVNYKMLHKLTCYRNMPFEDAVKKLTK